jgi:ADP-heptose:LPS heptosyltransferase
MAEKYAIFHIDGGCGKCILATSVIKSIKVAYPDHKLIVISSYPEVFIHNPLIYRTYRVGNTPYFYENYIKNKNSKIFKLDPYHAESFINKEKHLIEIWCDLYNIPYVDSSPVIFLTQREFINIQNKLKKQGPILIVQPFGGSEEQHHQYSWARDFHPEFIQDVVNDLKPNYSQILHIKRENQPILENTTPIVDSFRNLFCYIALSDSFLCIDSFVQHAAAAFKKKAVVGWISNSPKIFGHKLHDNILAESTKSFRHEIDSYLESEDWTGSRFYECPYDNLKNIFKKQDFVKKLVKD